MTFKQWVDLVSGIGIPIIIVTLAAIGFLMKRWIQRTSKLEALTLQSLSLDVLRKKADLLRTLAEQPQHLGRHLRNEILEAFGEVPDLDLSASVAQNVVCIVTCPPKSVRVEGIAEITADIYLQFTGRLEPGQQSVRVHIAVTPNLNVTNRHDEHGMTDAVLRNGEGQLGRARIEAGNRLVFQDVEIHALKTGVVADQLRVSHLRVNISQVSGPNWHALTPPPLVAFVSVQLEGQTHATHLARELVTIGRPWLSLLSDVRTPKDEPYSNQPIEEAESVSLENWNRLRTSSTAALTSHIRLEEGFEDAFKTAKEEAGADEASEYQGTRFMVKFLGVPEGAELYVTTRDVNPGTSQPEPRTRDPYLKAVLITGTDSNGAGGFVPRTGAIPEGDAMTPGGVPLQKIEVSRGFGLAVWQWVSQDPDSKRKAEHVSFGVAVAVPHRPARSELMKVEATFAPTSTVLTSSRDAPVPRFIDFGGIRTAFFIQSEDDHRESQETIH